MHEEIGFWGILWKAWGSGLAAIFRMPVLFISSAIALILVGGVNFYLLAHTIASGQGPHATALGILELNAIRLLAAFLSALVSAPLAVAVHRYVLLGESDDHPFWRWREEVPRFIGWLILMTVLFMVPGLFQSVLSSLSPALDHVLGLLLSIVVTFIYVRMILIFPAVAIGAANANSDHCWRISQGHFWYFYGAVICSTWPLLILGFLLGVVSVLFSHLFSWLILALVIVLPVYVVVLVALASLLYRKFDNAAPPNRSTAEFTLGRP